MSDSTPQSTMSILGWEFPAHLLDSTTMISLASTLFLLHIAHSLQMYLMSPNSPLSHRVLFVWHAWDALIHFCLEGSYLYNCFFVFADVVTGSTPNTGSPSSLSGSGSELPYGAFSTAPLQSSAINFLSDSAHNYGPNYGDNPFAKLWRVYARADRRWGEADPTIISLELLTVFGGGLLAVWICGCLVRRDPMANFWMVVLAIGELYGGFITFCPEWLTGNLNLDTSNFMYLYVYLIFFNCLWVALPIYAIHVAFNDMKNAFMIRNGVITASVLRAQKVREEATLQEDSPRKGKAGALKKGSK